MNSHISSDSFHPYVKKKLKLIGRKETGKVNLSLCSSLFDNYSSLWSSAESSAGSSPFGRSVFRGTRKTFARKVGRSVFRGTRKTFALLSSGSFSFGKRCLPRSAEDLRTKGEGRRRKIGRRPKYGKGITGKSQRENCLPRSAEELRTRESTRQKTGFCQKSFALHAEKSERLQALVEKASKSMVQDISSATQTSEEDLYRVLDEIQRHRKCTEQDAFCALVLLAQIGAVSPKAQDGVKVVINSTEFKIQLIRNIIKSVTKKNFRRLAKTYASEFYNVAKNFDYAGNLYNKILLKYPDSKINEKDKHWFSDFQSENENCPKEIRDLINRYYEDYIKKDAKKK